jgi:iron complex outermembrane receptor protein
MIKRTGFLLLLASSIFSFSIAQVTQNDSTRILNEVVVRAYLYNRPMSEVPAAVVTLDQKDLERFNNTSFLPAVNLVPGVRMEERSPGSYRFSIRGSLLRSPFGVRNVKMYWNGLPLTDGGGNTYLNLLDFNSVTNTEIIKGPGGSLYGAGTGGVVLFTKDPVQPGLRLSTVFGSYGLATVSSVREFWKRQG